MILVSTNPESGNTEFRKTEDQPPSAVLTKDLIYFFNEGGTAVLQIKDGESLQETLRETLKEPASRIASGIINPDHQAFLNELATSLDPETRGSATPPRSAGMPAAFAAPYGVAPFAETGVDPLALNQENHR